MEKMGGLPMRRYKKSKKGKCKLKPTDQEFWTGVIVDTKTERFKRLEKEYLQLRKKLEKFFNKTNKQFEGSLSKIIVQGVSRDKEKAV